MKIKKTVGFVDGDGKGYTIHTECGQEFVCTKSGNKWNCGDYEFGQIKEIKQAIEDGKFDADAEDTQTQESVRVEDGKTWACVQPEAYLIKIVSRLDLDASMTVGIMDTLNKNGWLTDDLQLDHSRADREFERVKKLLGSYNEQKEIDEDRSLPSDGGETL